MPHRAIKTVAERSEAINGAKTIEQANTMCEKIQAVSRLGFLPDTCLTIVAMLWGGLGVNSGFSSSSGALTTHGRVIDPTKVTIEKTMRVMLPTRPISPRVSVDCEIRCGASYRR